MHPEMNDQTYMQRALDLALQAKGQTSPNPMVGCVIVKNNQVIAQGWHKKAGFDHAEVVALKKAKDKARGATMYVTLEPCAHFGRTPPCVKRIIESGIKEVVIAMKDPNPLVSGRSIAQLKKSGIRINVGLFESQARELNEVFIKYITQSMPFVVGKIAQTLDGKIATSTGHSQWITSEKTRQFSRYLRDEFDAILVGINTVIKDNPQLTGLRKDKTLRKIILDPTLRISPQAKLFQNISPEHCIMATTTQAPINKVNLFRKKGSHVLICPKKQGKIDLRWLFKELAKKEITSILIEGGARTIGEALKQNVIDKMHIYMAPKILGDEKALSSVVGLNIKDVNRSFRLQHMHYYNIGEDVFLTGYVHGNH